MFVKENFLFFSLKDARWDDNEKWKESSIIPFFFDKFTLAVQDYILSFTPFYKKITSSTHKCYENQ